MVLGIDPGTASTGYGVLAGSGDAVRLIDWGCVETDSRTAPAQRLRKIYEALRGIMLAYSPDVVAIEELFFNRNARTALAVGQGRGVAMLAAAQHGVEVREYTPLEVKQAVAGYGRASKEQVQRMLVASLDLGAAPQPDDAADAVAVALCCIRSYRFEKKVGLREDGG